MNEEFPESPGGQPISGTVRPAIRLGLNVESLGDEFIVIDGARNRVHALNPTAKSVFDLLDGSRTTGDIANEFQVRYPQMDLAQLRGDVEKIVQEFLREGLALE